MEEPFPLSVPARTVRGMETRDVPCTQCGSTVYMITGDQPKRMAERVPRTMQVARCSNAQCPTNPSASTRKLGTPRP